MTNTIATAHSNLFVIDKMIDNIGKSNASLVKAVQQAATMIVIHAVEHGDVSRADRLVSAIEGMRRDSLVQWFLTQGCMRLIEGKTDTGKTVKSFGLNQERRSVLAKAIENESKAVVAGRLQRDVPWYQAKKESDPYQPLDLTKALRTLLNKANKAASNPQVAQKSDLSLLAALKAIVPAQSKLNT